MAQIEVKRVQATATVGDLDPQWEVVVDYGHGVEVCIPLAAHCLRNDDVEMQQRLSLEAMENLGKNSNTMAARLGLNSLRID
jgi:hypothetical protein